MVVGDMVQGMAGQPQAQPGMEEKAKEMLDIQTEMQENVRAVNARYWTAIVAFLVVLLAVASGLLVGGIKALRMDPVGRKLLLAACSIAILFELGRAIFTVILQIEVMTVMTASMSRMAEAAAPENMADAERFSSVLSMVMQGAMIAGLVLGLAFVLVKVVFYVIGALYLRRENVRQLYEKNAASKGPYFDAGIVG